MRKIIGNKQEKRMRRKRSLILLVSGVMMVVMAVAMFPPSASAQGKVCYDPAGAQIPCPEKKPTEAPKTVPTFTPTPTATETATPTSVPIPTATWTALPITGSGAGPNNPNSSLPAVQDPSQGSSPFNFPGPLGMIILVLIIAIGIMAGFFMAERRRRIGNNGGLGNLPYLERGGNENATITVPSVGGLDGALGSLPAIQRGGNENFTMTVHEVGDVSPDAARSAREAASDPGGANQFAGKFPGPPIKPPSPNIGDKSGGGTL
jgi:hypothetical protein